MQYSRRAFLFAAHAMLAAAVPTTPVMSDQSSPSAMNAAAWSRTKQAQVVKSYLVALDRHNDACARLNALWDRYNLGEYENHASSGDPFAVEQYRAKRRSIGFDEVARLADEAEALLDAEIRKIEALGIGNIVGWKQTV